MDLGFASVGYDVRACLDNDYHSCRTLEINEDKRDYFKSHAVLQKSIRDTSADELRTACEPPLENVDVVIGGPPCQAFSVFGRRKGLGDPRGNLVWEFLRIVKDLQPTVFVFENVYGLKSIHNGALYQDLLRELSIGGAYVVSNHDYQLANFGIPQYRSRVFFIGWKDGDRIPPMVETHAPDGDPLGARPYVTVGKALSGMPEPSDACTIPNHIGRDHSTRIVDRYRGLRFGERDPKTRINKLDPGRPSFTIIVGSDHGGGKGHVHPYSPREVTPRESARIQTFPDWWVFHGTGRHVIRQVGNAVPPLFAALLGQHIAKYVFGRSRLASYEALAHNLGLDFLL